MPFIEMKWWGWRWKWLINDLKEMEDMKEISRCRSRVGVGWGVGLREGVRKDCLTAWALIGMIAGFNQGKVWVVGGCRGLTVWRHNNTHCATTGLSDQLNMHALGLVLFDEEYCNVHGRKTKGYDHVNHEQIRSDGWGFSLVSLTLLDKTNIMDQNNEISFRSGVQQPHLTSFNIYV